MNVDSNMLSNIKAAEGALARKQGIRRGDELKETIDKLPEDHPLVVAAMEEMAKVGDLKDLPPGHPIIRALVEAKIRNEGFPEEERHEPTGHAKSRREVQAEERVRDEELSSIRRMAGKTVNGKIDGVVGSMADLYDTVKGLHDELSSDPYARVHLAKLERLLMASKRGLEDCRLSIPRL